MAFHHGSSEDEEEMAMTVNLRRGPWTEEEDLVLVNYVAAHGEGRWNSLARCAGLRRTGKSCRLRWLNYLRPDVRRGNITPEEQLLILQLHSRWGNRWSKIAQHLPGRTDNEIKNYWRTRVQKHAKQLKCDVNSKKFKDVMRFVWMPHLVERIGAAATAAAASSVDSMAAATENDEAVIPMLRGGGAAQDAKLISPENSSGGGSSASLDSFGMEFFTDFAAGGDDAGGMQPSHLASCSLEFSAYTADLGSSDLDQSVWGENLWSVEELWLEQQF